MKLYMTFIDKHTIDQKCDFFVKYVNMIKCNKKKNAHFDVMKSCITWWPKGIYIKQAVFSQDFSFLSPPIDLTIDRKASSVCLLKEMWNKY